MTTGTRIAGLALAAVLALTAPTSAQQQGVERVSFRTFDGVKLRGEFYTARGVSGRKAPVVILIHGHGPGKDRTKGNWQQLAVALQAKGYSVLTFDLRGHGDSTELDSEQTFWRTVPNFRLANIRKRILPQVPATFERRINVKEFHPDYYPIHIQDIAAARRYVDEQNDAGSCNSGRIFLVAEDGLAALATMWIGSEYLRNGIAPAGLGLAPPNLVAGTDIAGAVWLSMEMQPAVRGKRRSIPIYPINRVWSSGSRIGRQLKDNLNVCFLYGDGDRRGTKNAAYMAKNLLRAGSVEAANQRVYLKPIKGTSDDGIDLLNAAGAGVDTTIIEFFNEMQKRGVGNNWIRRNVDKIGLQQVRLSVLGFRGFP